MNTSFTKPLYLAGPTASGKSSLALALAEKFNGEIISVDSMQVYRGLDIGTAKPTPEERQRIPHHLIDIIELSDTFDAAQFRARALEASHHIQSRGRLPIFCGGTGFYFSALLAGLGNAPPSDPKLRAELETIPLDTLLEELKAKDPLAFEKIDRKNPRRVVRAIEVIRLTGKTFSEQRAAWDKRCEYPNFFGLRRTDADLLERINRRVDEMFAQGLVEETRALMARGLEQNKTAMQSLGYRQVAEHLRGERSLPETIELVKIRTRQFAKRQRTWFRYQMSFIQWMDADDHTKADDLIAQILKAAK